MSGTRHDECPSPDDSTSIELHDHRSQSSSSSCHTTKSCVVDSDAVAKRRRKSIEKGTANSTLPSMYLWETRAKGKLGKSAKGDRGKTNNEQESSFHLKTYPPPSHNTARDAVVGETSTMSSEGCVVNLFEDEDFLRQQRELMKQYTSSARPADHSHDDLFPSTRDNGYEASPLDAEDKDHSCGKPRNEVPSYSRTSTSTTDSASSTEDCNFLDFMYDPEFLREQREAMARIAQQNHSNTSTRKLDTTDTQQDHLKELNSNVEEATRLYKEARKFATDSPSKRKPVSKKGEPKPESPLRTQDASSPKTNVFDTRASTNFQMKEKKVELYDGQRLRIRGTDHTWKQIAKGEATLVQCPSCQSFLQVGSKAKLVYCLKCGNVSPIDVVLHSRSRTNNRGDTPLAVALQSQEMEIALAKKMAKVAAGGNRVQKKK